MGNVNMSIASLIFGILFVLGSFTHLSAKTIVAPVDTTSYEQRLETGIDAFYRADWTQANTIFKELQAEKPNDSRAYFFESMIPFWKYYFGGESKEDANEFLDKSRKALEISKQQLDSNANDTTMVLMLSGLYGYRSLVSAAEENYREALQSGMTGFKYTRQLLALDDDDPKALIGKGMFYYMVGSVPNGLKWVTNIAGMSADMQEGFEALERAAGDQSYVRNDAQMILAYLYEREEKYSKALSHLEELTNRYPENIIFQYNRARLLEKTDQLDEARKKYELVTTMPANNLDQLIEKSRNRLQQL